VADLSEEEGVTILRETAVAGSCVTLVNTPIPAIQRLDSVLLSNVRVELWSYICDVCNLEHVTVTLVIHCFSALRMDAECFRITAPNYMKP
jgi:hypothetical protein